MVAQRVGRFLTEGKYRKFHFAIIAVALVVHLSLHYATYIPALREPLGDLPYMRLHVLHEAEFLLIVVYAALVFGLKGGLTAVAITGVTSIPFLLTPFIFGREPRPDEIRDLGTQVFFILLMGALMSVLSEAIKRDRDRHVQMAAAIEKADQELQTRNAELDQMNRELERSGREVAALNRFTQQRLNTLFGELRGIVDDEGRHVLEATPHPLRDRFAQFLLRVSALIDPQGDRATP